MWRWVNIHSGYALEEVDARPKNLQPPPGLNLDFVPIRFRVRTMRITYSTCTKQLFEINSKLSKQLVKPQPIEFMLCFTQVEEVKMGRKIK